MPHVITHVETTAGPVSDGAVTPRIHEALAHTGLLPRTHFVDTGYLDAELLATSQREYGVDLLGPTRPDYKWQAQAAQGLMSVISRLTGSITGRPVREGGRASTGRQR